MVQQVVVLKAKLKLNLFVDGVGISLKLSLRQAKIKAIEQSFGRQEPSRSANVEKSGSKENKKLEKLKCFL